MTPDERPDLTCEGPGERPGERPGDRPDVLPDVLPGTSIDIDWNHARAANLANWEDRAVLHEQAYGLDRFADPRYLTPVVEDDLPVLAEHLPGRSLAGLDLVHLQCHLGTDTIALARAGARVTGVDFSPSALAVARRLAASTNTAATWVQTDVLEARAAVSGDFDVVYTSIGTICWLPDLDRWAAQVVALLRPGGIFYIRDGHQMLYTLDENAEDLRLRYRYFPNGQAETWDDPTTYAGSGTVAHSRTYEWPHPISEVVGALLRAGLRLERLDEGRTLPWQFSGRMVEESPGRYVWPGEERDRVPCTFTVVARRPAG